LDTCVTSGVLPFALRASLWLFKIAPGDFVAGMTLSGVFAGSMKIFTHSIWGRANKVQAPCGCFAGSRCAITLEWKL
ncbi:MAG: hypothetical protein WBP02_13970, partial [Gammaproteobacteria bacterium]